MLTALSVLVPLLAHLGGDHLVAYHAGRCLVPEAIPRLVLLVSCRLTEAVFSLVQTHVERCLEELLADTDLLMLEAGLPLADFIRVLDCGLICTSRWHHLQAVFESHRCQQAPLGLQGGRRCRLHDIFCDDQLLLAHRCWIWLV